MRLAVVLSEFGPQEVSTLQYRRLWPDAEIRVIRDGDVADVFASHGPRHPRWGWRMHDYWQARMLLNIDADVVMAFDNDMRVVDPQAKHLPNFAWRYGICLPANPRKLVAVDAAIGADSFRIRPPDGGLGYALNTTPIGLNRAHGRAVAVVETFCELMLKTPARAPLLWSQAFSMHAFSPCVLPPQWCVCEADINCGNELILHEGHAAVKRHYVHVPSV